MAHANTIKSEPKPYFTDYTVAGTDEGRYNAARLRESNQQAEDYIRTGRSLRRMCRKSMAARNNQHQARGGFPKDREIDYSLPSKKGQLKALNRFKVVSKLISTGEESMVYVTKIFQLHATRGWKLYA